jgi:hypothetical protein
MQHFLKQSKDMNVIGILKLGEYFELLSSRRPPRRPSEVPIDSLRHGARWAECGLLARLTSIPSRMIKLHRLVPCVLFNLW